ncbi:MAG: asparaginase [Pseudomonadota bacterium]
MADPPPVLVEVTRGDRVESRHRGHAVVVDDIGAIIAAWGDPQTLIYPRSAAKMLQALPLLESRAGGALSDAHLALACASHSGATIHTSRVTAWLADLGLDETALRCGPQPPNDRDARAALNGAEPTQVHNNCSGKHTGFLTLAQHLKAGPNYIDADHPVQRAARAAMEDMAQEDSPGWGIDGCSAPNFAFTLAGFGRALALMAAPDRLARTRATAAERLVRAMMAHPDLVAGEGRACTRLMRVMPGHLALKTGAEGVFAAILPARRMAVALKIEDGATRASEAAIAALLVHLGVLDPADPRVRAFTHAPIFNRRNIETGHTRAVQTAFAGG